MTYLKGFERSTALLVDMFCKKQDAEVEFIVADQICGIYCIADNFFSLDDIYFDMKTKQKKGKIFEWQNDGIEAHFNVITENINYRSYCMGSRYKIETNE